MGISKQRPSALVRVEQQVILKTISFFYTPPSNLDLRFGRSAAMASADLSLQPRLPFPIFSPSEREKKKKSRRERKARVPRRSAPEVSARGDRAHGPPRPRARKQELSTRRGMMVQLPISCS